MIRTDMRQFWPRAMPRDFPRPLKTRKSRRRLGLARVWQSNGHGGASDQDVKVQAGVDLEDPSSQRDCELHTQTKNLRRLDWGEWG